MNFPRLNIADPETFELFKDGRIGAEAKSVRIISSATADLFHQAADFFNRTNDEIMLMDGNNTIILNPLTQSVNATFLHGTNMTQYLPEWYKQYTLTFTQDEMNNEANWRNISTFQNAEKLFIGKGFELGPGYRKRTGGLWKLRKLRELSIYIDESISKVSKIDLNPLMSSPWSLRTVCIITSSPGAAKRLAEDQCPLPEWGFGFTIFNIVQFDKMDEPDYRHCSSRRHPKLVKVLEAMKVVGTVIGNVAKFVFCIW